MRISSETEENLRGKTPKEEEEERSEANTLKRSRNVNLNGGTGQKAVQNPYRSIAGKMRSRPKATVMEREKRIPVDPFLLPPRCQSMLRLLLVGIRCMQVLSKSTLMGRLKTWECQLLVVVLRGILQVNSCGGFQEI